MDITGIKKKRFKIKENNKTIRNYKMRTYNMKQSHWLLCVAKHCDWPKKITSLANLIRTASRV